MRITVGCPGSRSRQNMAKSKGGMGSSGCTKKPRFKFAYYKVWPDLTIEVVPYEGASLMV